MAVKSQVGGKKRTREANAGKKCDAGDLIKVGFCGELFEAVFFFQAEDGIRDDLVSGVQTCALPISFVAFAFHCWWV